MDALSDSGAKPPDRTLVLARVFDAPRELMFQAWTDPRDLAQWWGPAGVTNLVVDMDLRVGGALRIVMRSPENTDHAMTGVFREIAPAQRLDFSHAAVDESGRTLLDGLTTVTCADEGGKTKLTLETTATARTEAAKLMLKGMDQRWMESLDKLAAYLPQALRQANSVNAAPDYAGAADPETVTLTRAFAAPRDLVFQAWTVPDQLAQWWVPKGAALRVASFDLQRGGLFHYALQMADSKEVWAKFVFREITRPERLGFVSAYSNDRGRTTWHPFIPDWPLEVLNVVTFTEQGGTTALTMQASPLNASEAERKRFAAAYGSLEQGFNGSFDQLAAVLAKA